MPSRSIAPDAALLRGETGGQAQAALIKVALLGLVMAGRAVGGALDLGQLPDRRGDSAVLALEPGRARDAVFRRRFARAPFVAGMVAQLIALPPAGGGAAAGITRMVLQPGVDLLGGSWVDRSVGAVVPVQPRHDALP